MIKKVVHILKGWGKRFGIIPVSSAEVKMAELRMELCGGCSKSKNSKFLQFVNGEAEYGTHLYCTACSCPCYEKTIVTDEKCPISKW